MKHISVILTCLLLCCAPTAKQNYDLVLHNGKIIDLVSGEISQKHLFITDGRIQKVGTSNEPYDAKDIIDLQGRYVLPGFWDNHVHFRGGDSLIAANKNFLRLFIANGITTVRDAGGDLTPTVMQWKGQIKTGKLLGPEIFSSGPKIDGVNASWAGSLVVEDSLDVVNALDSLEAIHADYVKLYDSRISGEVYLETIRAAERRKMISSGHMPFTVLLEDAINAGIDGVEHLYYIMKGCSAKETEITARLKAKEIGFWQAMPLLQTSYNDSTAQNTFALLRANEVFVIPTLHIGKTLSYLDEVDHSSDEYLKYIGPGIQKTYQGRISRALKASPEARENRKELDAFFGTLAKSLNDAKVDLLAGSDSGAFNSYTYPGISLHQELQAMVNNGISPLDALKSSAYNGARFLHRTKDYGNIEVGKISDLVILDANPLEDISNTQRIHMVLKRGQVYNSKKLTKLLQEAIIN
ncbi:MAG: amidohydrolase family protein [Flavobacteriaceae bacterium]